MNTWTSKVCAAPLLCLTLAACEGGIGLGGTEPADALRSADLSRGAVTLVAPTGFCIDARSLRSRFALMARCDTLGAEGAGDAPLALITATTLAAGADAPLGTDGLQADAESVVTRDERDGLALVQLRGTPPSPAFRDTYWRAASVVGGELVGLTIYEAADGAPLGPAAPGLLAQAMQRTQDRTAARADNSATPPDNNQRNGLLAGLFE